MAHLCTLHKKEELTAYCDSCRDAVCSQCTHLGPHADSRHAIMPLEEASRIRQMFYLAYRDKEIRPTLQKIYDHLSSLSARQQILSQQRRVIEKDIALQFQGITQRASNLISKQTIKKQTEVKNYQQIINQLEDLVYSFDSVVQFPQRFLLCYRQLHQQLKQLQTITINIHRPQDSVLTIKTVDMKAISTSWHLPQVEQENLHIPREMALSFARANQLPQYAQKNYFMNQLVAKTVEHYHTEIAKAKRDVILNQKRILHWFNHQNSQLLQFNKAMVCAYCMAAFSINEANQPCAYNKSYKSEHSYKDIEMPVEIRGQKMHYWVKAKKQQRPIPDINAHFLIRNVQKKQYKNSLAAIQSITFNLKCYDIQKGQPKAHLQQFKSNDPRQTGLVTPLAFLFIMTNKFQIDETQVKVISELCLNEDKTMVNYTKMEEILSDPLDVYRRYEAEEEEIQKAKPQAPPSFRYRY